MEKEDARYQKLEQLHERRKQVERLHLAGTAVMQIVGLTGLSYPTVRKAIDLFADGGWPALKPGARGRSAGDGRRLSTGMIIDGAFNHERLIEFLQALVRDGKRRRRKVFLILDNLGVHHCKPVKAWLAEHAKHIEVFYLPSYSPELNPGERLNADLKHAIGSKMPVRTKAKLRAAADEHMQFVAANAARVRSYFQDPFAKYAA
ncbi:transposase [Ralstonia pseudosolanacearum]|uniref:Tc1-like transposase DDE domain-containing protein n=1 Tax=Ralstonia solanacearum TaxID=305 RepID=A0A0S4TV81_RALSL|nr:protein of unknown function [Ralstonia solanacearum]